MLSGKTTNIILLYCSIKGDRRQSAVVHLFARILCVDVAAPSLSIFLYNLRNRHKVPYL